MQVIVLRGQRYGIHDIVAAATGSGRLGSGEHASGPMFSGKLALHQKQRGPALKTNRKAGSQSAKGTVKTDESLWLTYSDTLPAHLAMRYT